MVSRANQQWARRRRDEYYTRVCGMLQAASNMTELEKVNVIVNCVKHQMADGYVIHDAYHDGMDTVTLEIQRPGGGFEVVTVAIV